MNAPASALLHAVTNGTAYYDPMEHVGNLIKTPSLLKAVQSSLCWYADVTYVRELRSLFWAMYEGQVETGGIDNYNDFANAMAEREFNEYVTSQQGFDSNSGPTVLRQLARLRAAWYDDNLNSEAKMPSLPDLLTNEKPARINADQTKRLDILAKAMADGDAEMEKVLLTSLIEKEQSRAAFSHTQRQRVNPCLELIDAFITRTDIGDGAQFHELPMPIQKRLVENTVAVLNNSILQMSRDRKMDLLEFGAATIEASKAIKAVKAVLEQPRFKNCEL